MPRNPQLKEDQYFETAEGGIDPRTKYSVAYFMNNKRKPCSKCRATMMQIVEHDETGEFINSTCGYIG